jgi:hypothetical protein
MAPSGLSGTANLAPAPAATTVTTGETGAAAAPTTMTCLVPYIGPAPIPVDLFKAAPVPICTQARTRSPPASRVLLTG